MIRLFVSILAAAVGLLVLAPRPAHADLRDYIFNQGYYTPKKGEFEVELYNDYNFTDTANSDEDSSKHQVELEYGLTSHLALAYYEVYGWNREEDFNREELKVETKYRFLEAGELPVDIALYAEYVNPNGHQEVRSDEMELKLILSKNLGPWNVTGNFIAEREINQHDPWALEYTLGVSYPIHPKVHLGLEIKETLGKTDNLGIHRDDHEFQLMPVVAASLTPHSRILFGPAIGLTHAADDLQLKSIVEIEF